MTLLHQQQQQEEAIDERPGVLGMISRSDLQQGTHGFNITIGDQRSFDMVRATNRCSSVTRAHHFSCKINFLLRMFLTEHVPKASGWPARGR
jgi:hypothetical protein